MGSDEYFRLKPFSSYIPNDSCLCLPTNALEITLEYLRCVGSFESCVFWYGHRNELGDGKVAAIFTPQQRMTWGNYDVSAAAMSHMLEHVRDDWRPLAQIHSHPGRMVEHSSYDDQMISSRRILSIVFPFYGRWNGLWPNHIGVHEWQENYWHLLQNEVASKRVQLSEPVPIIARDLRS